MQWFKDLKISNKLAIGFLILILVVATVGGMGYWSSGRIYNSVDNIYKIVLPSIDYLVQADRDLQQLLVAERSMIFANTDSDIFKTRFA